MGSILLSVVTAIGVVGAGLVARLVAPLQVQLETTSQIDSTPTSSPTMENIDTRHVNSKYNFSFNYAESVQKNSSELYTLPNSKIRVIETSFPLTLSETAIKEFAISKVKALCQEEGRECLDIASYFQFKTSTGSSGYKAVVKLQENQEMEVYLFLLSTNIFSGKATLAIVFPKIGSEKNQEAFNVSQTFTIK